MFIELHFLFFASLISLVDTALLKIHRSTLTAALLTLCPVLPWFMITIAFSLHFFLAKTNAMNFRGVGKGDILLIPLAIGYLSSGHSFSDFTFFLIMMILFKSLTSRSVVIGIEHRYAGAPPIFLLTLLISEMH